MYNTAPQIHRGKQRWLVAFIGCSLAEIALSNLGSNSLGTGCNISLFYFFSAHLLQESVNGEPSGLFGFGLVALGFLMVGHESDAELLLR